MTYYLIIGITFLVSIIVNTILKNKFITYSKLRLHSTNMSGKEIAEKMLIDHGIYDVKVLYTEGDLMDHYNPLNKTINLSEKVYYESSTAAIAVASHECGHALQHKLGYNLLKFRNHLISILNFSSIFINLAIISGLTLFYNSGGNNSFILQLGIGSFFLVVCFSFITLPIEFNASNRALNWMKNKNIVNYQEYQKAKESLNWAAMTYVVSALGSLAQLLYFLSMFTTTEKEDH
ncbi:zinc metallopeptidase [Blattabacterium cuenoti]|uniref:zinc metallopeptidase n=1 Tax=Blattabacterium cuenoti TaxID=1653831 RepID=UPI00163D1649|nr:zinc metallopeptidase [Blattabacterium cuenoti]